MSYKINQEAHACTLDSGRVIPSVTQILDLVFPFADPFAGYDAARAMEEGTRIHKLCEGIAKGEPIICDIGAAYKEWLDTIKAKNIRTEVTMVDEGRGFWGTADIIFQGNDDATWIIDLKSGANNPKKFALQTAGYARLYAKITRENRFLINRGVLYNLKNAKPVFTVFTDKNDIDLWDSLLDIYTYAKN